MLHQKYIVKRIFVEVIVAVGESKSAVRSASFIGINFKEGVTGEYNGCYATYF